MDVAYFVPDDRLPSVGAADQTRREPLAHLTSSILPHVLLTGLELDDYRVYMHHSRIGMYYYSLARARGGRCPAVRCDRPTPHCGCRAAR